MITEPEPTVSDAIADAKVANVRIDILEDVVFATRDRVDRLEEPGASFIPQTHPLYLVAEHVHRSNFATVEHVIGWQPVDGEYHPVVAGTFGVATKVDPSASGVVFHLLTDRADAVELAQLLSPGASS